MSPGKYCRVQGSNLLVRTKLGLLMRTVYHDASWTWSIVCMMASSVFSQRTAVRAAGGAGCAHDGGDGDHLPRGRRAARCLH